jgi:hypothetical protein
MVAGATLELGIRASGFFSHYGLEIRHSLHAWSQLEDKMDYPAYRR